MSTAYFGVTDSVHAALPCVPASGPRSGRERVGDRDATTTTVPGAFPAMSGPV